jgi:hypothetical protein
MLGGLLSSLGWAERDVSVRTSEVLEIAELEGSVIKQLIVETIRPPVDVVLLTPGSLARQHQEAT